ncbi:MAG TPA: glycosyltransferase [Thermoanaerobaculia bacterium]|jgi:chlorobactene glucosyltransferase|nr:glycosyltransferase [Thermoanaerobaculia bacterium]
MATPRLSRVASRPGGDPDAPPRVSVVVPARNEELAIELAVRSHLEQDYPPDRFEVVVVDDRSTDATGAILDRLAADHPRLIVVHGAEPPPGWLGKPHALHQGITRATGELLLLADADVRYDRRALREAVALLESRRVDLLALFPHLEMEGFWENVLLPYVPASFFLGPGALLNSDLQKRWAVGAGAGMLMRRGAYERAGGHEAIRSSVIDDLHLALNVRRSGGRCRIARADDRMSLRMYRGYREVRDGFTKNIAWVFDGVTGVLLALSTLLSIAAYVLPPAVLAAALFGASVSRADVVLAAAGWGGMVAARLGMAAALRYPLWAAFTQPLMALAWTEIIVRSFVRRFLRREVEWRGRRYDAKGASF